MMPAPSPDRTDRRGRSGRRESGQSAAALRAARPPSAVTAAQRSAEETARLNDATVALQQGEERRGEEAKWEEVGRRERGSKGTGDREERKMRGWTEAGGDDETVDWRWRIQQLEKDKLELTSLYNEEVCRLQAEAARLRSDVERGEVDRQSLEYQLAVIRRQEERSKSLTLHNNKMSVRVEELQQTVSDLQRALDMSRQAREEDQHALQQEECERDKLVQNARLENDRLMSQKEQLNQLLEQQEEALQVLKNRVAEDEGEREKRDESIRQLQSQLHKMEERKKEVEEQKVKSLESSIEAERAAHLQSKFNAEAIQLRVRDLESVVCAEKSGHQEALCNLELLRSQFREVERAYSLERERTLSATHTLDNLEMEYQQCKSELSVALETERQMTCDLVDRLEEEKRVHANTQSLLEQAEKRQALLEDSFINFIKQITQTLKQHSKETSHQGSSSPAKQEVTVGQWIVVLELLKTTLSNDQDNLDTSAQQVQDLLCASEKLDQDNQRLRQLLSDQKQQTQEYEALLPPLQQEVMRLHQESSDMSAQCQDAHLALERDRKEMGIEKDRERKEMERERKAMGIEIERERKEMVIEMERERKELGIEMERERKEMERVKERERKEMERAKERERKERKAEVQKMTDLYQKESQERLSFLYSLYQRLLVGCVLLDKSQGILGNFTWAELRDVISEQANRLTSDLSEANKKIAHLQGVCDSQSVCVRELQRSQECVLSRLEQSVKQREEAWSALRRQEEEQHAHAVTQLQQQNQLYRSRCDSLQEHLSGTERECSAMTADLSKLRGLLAQGRRESSRLLAGAALLAGALMHTLRRAQALSEQKSVMCWRLKDREELEGEVRKLAAALGGEGEEEKGKQRRRRWRLLRWRRCVCVVLASNRLRVLARTSAVALRLQSGERAVCVCLPGGIGTATDNRPPTTDKEDDDESTGDVVADWLRSKPLSSLLLSSMSDLQEVLSHTGSSPKEVMSAARSGLSHILEHLLNQSDATSCIALSEGRCSDTKCTLASRLANGLSRLTAPRPSSETLVSSLQQHFLLFSQRLHSTEVERRGLRLEVADLKRAAKGQKGLCDLIPVERFSSVCEELRGALNREEQVQGLLKEQSVQNGTLSKSLSVCRQEVRHKEQSLRILGKHLSEEQKARRELEERLRQAKASLTHMARRRNALIKLMKNTESSFKEVKESLVQSRHPGLPHTLPPQLPRMHLEQSSTESTLGVAELTACQTLLSSFSDLYQAASSRIVRLEQEVSAHSSHVTALRNELPDACLHDNLAFVPLTEPSRTSPLAEQDDRRPGRFPDWPTYPTGHVHSNQLPDGLPLALC